MAAADRRGLFEGPCLATTAVSRRSTAMIIVDRALSAREAAGNPIRVGMIGAGALGHALPEQIIGSVTGMKFVATSHRHVEAPHAPHAPPRLPPARCGPHRPTPAGAAPPRPL